MILFFGWRVAAVSIGADFVWFQYATRLCHANPVDPCLRVVGAMMLLEPDTVAAWTVPTVVLSQSIVPGPTSIIPFVPPSIGISLNVQV